MNMKNILFRLPSYILNNMKDGMRVSELCSPEHVSYAHVWNTIRLFVREGIVTIDTSDKTKVYNLTFKGIIIRNYIKKSYN